MHQLRLPIGEIKLLLTLVSVLFSLISDKCSPSGDIDIKPIFDDAWRQNFAAEVSSS